MRFRFPRCDTPLSRRHLQKTTLEIDIDIRRFVVQVWSHPKTLKFCERREMLSY
jgi:hypothetical protein